MERMKKEKESGTLLGVGTAYLPVKEIKGEFYVKVSDFTKCMDGIRIEQEADRKHIEKLEEENKELKLENAKLKDRIICDENFEEKLDKENKKLKLENADLMGERDGLKMAVEKLKEENQYRENIADVLPEGEGHIAEETIQDLQARIKELEEEVEVWKNANKILRMHDAKMEYENKELKKEREMLIEDLSSDKELQQQIAQKQVDYYRENQKLKEELSKYKKQYEHSMGFSDFSGYDDNNFNP